MADQSWQQPLAYMERIRRYYLALGYPEPYRWASQDSIPYTALAKRMSQVRLSIVTTAAPFQRDKGDQGPGAPYNGNAKFFDVYALPTDQEPDLRVSHIAIDRDHTTAEDQGSYFPLAAFRQLVTEGELGNLTNSFFGLPTHRSVRKTQEYGAEIVKHCIDEQADAAVLVPNCPVCHQSVSLVACQLEKAGVSTVVMGAAKDIVEYVGVPRLLFSDVPLGNAAGVPGRIDVQLQVAREALALLENAPAARTTRQSSAVWPGRRDWKKDYSNPDLLSDSQIQARRIEFDRVKSEAKAVQQSSD